MIDFEGGKFRFFVAPRHHVIMRPVAQRKRERERE